MSWSYTERVSRERQALLLAAPDFDAIIDRILADIDITGFDIVRGKIGAVKGCMRPEFSLRVSPDTFDLFFNSPRGYRGQYHQSPETAQRANANLISVMTDRLTDYALGNTTKHGMDAKRIRRSLAAGSAKIWIDEQGGRAQRGDDIKELKADLRVQPWLQTAQDYVANPAGQPAHAILAVDGVKAPTGTILDVKGAFINEDGNEHIPANKIDRAQQIHLYGFT